MINKRNTITKSKSVKYDILQKAYKFENLKKKNKK